MALFFTVKYVNLTNISKDTAARRYERVSFMTSHHRARPSELGWAASVSFGSALLRLRAPDGGVGGSSSGVARGAHIWMGLNIIHEYFATTYLKERAAQGKIWYCRLRLPSLHLPSKPGRQSEPEIDNKLAANAKAFRGISGRKELPGSKIRSPCSWQVNRRRRRRYVKRTCVLFQSRLPCKHFFILYDLRKKWWPDDA